MTKYTGAIDYKGSYGAAMPEVHIGTADSSTADMYQGFGRQGRGYFRGSQLDLVLGGDMERWVTDLGKSFDKGSDVRRLRALLGRFASSVGLRPILTILIVFGGRGVLSQWQRSGVVGDANLVFMGRRGGHGECCGRGL